MQARPYQNAAVQSLFDWWAAGRAGEWPCVVLPTAAGKTVIFSMLLKRLFDEYPNVTAIILAHRKELIEQAEAKLKSVWPTAPVGVYAASLGRKESSARILIAARDTIANKLDHIGQRTFVIIDESHNINQKDEGRYRKILAELKARYPHLVVIGFTATPFRLGQGRIYGKGKLFADVCFKIGMQDLIKDGYLAPLISAAVGAGEIDTTGIRTVGGDFDEHQLAEVATADALVTAALNDWKSKAFDTGRAATVFFCVSRLHAQIVSEKLAQMGIDCPFVTGETPDAERAALLAGFARGDFPAISNVGILTEGWDCPRCDCIALLRPTQSAALYVQMVGRGLRLSEGKADCLVLDYGGNIKRLGPVDQADIAEPKGGKKPNKKTGPCQVCNRELCKTCGTWDTDATGVYAWHNGCGHHNATGAKQCEACGQPFINHDTKAAAGGIISTERVIEVFDVEEVTCRVATSREGKRYLRVAYQVSLFETFYKNIMLGYPGYAGQKAWKEIVSIFSPANEPESDDGETHEGELSYYIGDPSDPARVVDAIAEGGVIFKPVSRIHVDVASKWMDIVQIDYADEVQHELAA
jgi:DNA repair protein RadD